MLPGITFSRLMAAAGAGGGGGGSLDTQTVTVGASGTSPVRRRGYQTSPALGSISDGTSNLYAGATIIDLYWNEDGELGEASFDLVFRLDGIHANSGWTTMTVDTSSFGRASAIFVASGGQTYWKWVGVGNPFGASGNKLVAFD